jgi:hypothetical protein
VFPVMYGLDFYILFRINSVLKGLSHYLKALELVYKIEKH